MKSVIFAAAHAVTRAIRAEFADADYRATFAAALRECYAAAAVADDVSADALAAAVMTEPAPRAVWESMPAEAQIDALLHVVWYCRNRDIAECDRRGEYRPNYFDWIGSAGSAEDDAANCAYDAWSDYMPAALARAEERAADGESMPTLRAIMTNACRNAARRIFRAEIKHNSALRIEARKDADGNETRREYIKDAQNTAEHMPDPYHAAAACDAIDRACADDTERAIVALTAAGYTQREIAERIGKSAMYVSRHLAAIRARHEDAPRGDRNARIINDARNRQRADEARAADADTWTYRAPYAREA